MIHANIMIYDDYIDYCTKYISQYGEKTVVLMEVGSFFELYAIDNNQEKSGADIYTVCDILNIQVSRKNKSIIENNRSNPLMAGFPSHSLQKHLQALLNNQYTIVLVRQVTPPPNPRREVTEILSPSMQLQPSGIDGNYLMVAYWDIFTDSLKRRYLSLGISCVDVSTGATFAYEIASSQRDPNLSLDEFVRTFQTYQPKELVLLGPQLEKDEINLIETALGVKYDTGRSIHRAWSTNVSHFTKIAYQNEVLRRAYNNDTRMIEPIDALHLEMYDNVRIAFVYMIQFGYEHNESFIKYLSHPIIHHYSSTCTLEYNSALQLNVISPNGSNDKPLIVWLNRCATSFGARRFRERLLQPLCNIEELEKRYDSIDKYLVDQRFKYVHSTLKNVMDLERIVRRMKLGTFSPTDWPGFDTSLRAIQEICEGNKYLLDAVTSCIDGYENTLIMDECSKYLLQDIRGTVFMEGIFPEVDVVVSAWRQAWNNLEALGKHFEHISEGEASCRIDHNEREGYSLLLTKRRWQIIQQQIKDQNLIDISINDHSSSQIDFSLFSAKTISSTSSTVRLKHPWIDAQSDEIIKLSSKIQKLVTSYYKEFLEDYIKKYKDLLEVIIETVADVDIGATCAKNAYEYKYRRPSLNSTHSQQQSYVEMKGMRHPILERILEKECYVPNDISIGGPCKNNGILLFGINASGKSSFMKAVGLNVLMAQAGMYVACDNMDLAPFMHIFTRIASSDNIFKGWSTFTVEMLELKNILHRCDGNSLVIGDELCSGTESISALAIVSAGIQMLRSKGSCFIFATHLHDLSSLQCIKNMDNISMQHMHVEIDSNGKISYDRRLRDGNGSAMYGLEVCKGLGLPSEFLKMAHEVRCEVEGISSDYQSKTKTRYNTNVFKHECQVCGAAATETHHIIPQKDADSDGFIGHFHKDRGFNLVNLCEDCHNNVHHGTLDIKGYVKTSEGRMLKFDYSKRGVDTEKQIRTNFTGEMINELWKTLRFANGIWMQKKRKVWRSIDEESANNYIQSITKCVCDINLLHQLEKDLHDPSLPLPK